MKQISLILLLVIILFATLTVAGQTPDKKPSNVLAVLKAGQSVSIKEVIGRYEISTLDGIPGVQGYKVLELGTDYLVAQDIVGITEIHIPVYSIKAIIRLKVLGK